MRVTDKDPTRDVLQFAAAILIASGGRMTLTYDLLKKSEGKIFYVNHKPEGVEFGVMEEPSRAYV